MRKRLAVVIASIAIVAGTCGCSAPGDSAYTSGSPSPVGVPGFTGPWAAEFREAYGSTTDATARRVIGKGSITDQDYAEISGEFTSCMKKKRFEVVVNDAYGRFTVMQADGDDPVLQSALRACSGGFDAVSGLRGSILRNPDHLDENEIVSSCLVRNGLVDKGYTAKDYAHEMTTGEFSYNSETQKAMDCQNDPLGIANGNG